MKCKLIFLLELLLIHPALAQQNFWSTLGQAVQDVQVKDDLYEQSFSFDAENSCLLTFTVLDTDDGDETTYEINASDLNEHKIRFDTRSREVVVEVETRGSKELVRVFEDGEAQDFDDEFQFYAADIENAREVVQALKEVVKDCRQRSNEILINGQANPSFENALSFLTSEIGEVEVEDGSINQTFTYDLSFPTLVTYEQEDNTEGEIYRYVANMIDFNEQSVSFDTEKGNVWVMMETIGGRDLIQTFENGEPDNYEHEFQILAEDIEHARMLEKALKSLIINAEGRYDASFIPGSTSTSMNQIVDFLTDQIGEVVLEKEIYEQSVTYDASTQQLRYDVIEASEGDKESYLVNPADINPNTIEFDTKGSEVLIELQTQAERDLVQELENEVIDGFTDDFIIRASTIDEARRWVGALKQLVLLAQENQENLFQTSVGDNPSSSATMQFLQNNVQEVASGDDLYQQTLAPAPDNRCLLTYTLIDEDGEEKVFEWNMADINPRPISFDTKSERIIVTLKTIAERDLIREIEEGEIEGYEDEVELFATSIEEARALVEAFKSLAESCKE